MTTGLITLSEFTSTNGVRLPFKIECNAIPDEWMMGFAFAIERMFADLGPPRLAIGVPTGGLRLAKQIDDSICSGIGQYILLVDDVLTTGKTITDWRDRLASSYPVYGVVLFARRMLPPWCRALFTTYEVAIPEEVPV